MSKRTKLKMRNAGLFLTKNVFNSRYIVRNIIAMTLVVTMVVLGFGASIVLKESRENKKALARQQAEVAVDMSIEEAVTVQASVSQMNADSIGILRAGFDENLQAVKEAKESEMVASAASFSDKFVTIQDDVNVRQEANTDSAIVGKMYTGVCGDVVATDGDWVQIQSGDVEGFVRADLVKTGAQAYDIAVKYYAATATALEDGVCLRAAASKEAEVVGAVYENVTYAVKLDKTTDDWVCIETSDDVEGYVFAEYMSVSEGFPVATKVENSAENTMTVVEVSGSDKKGNMSVTENKKSESTEETTEAVTTEAPATKTQTTQEATTQAPTTQATTQAPADNQANIGVTSRTPVSLSEADINLMAAVMTLECGGEPYEGQLAVANVILNRLQSGCYGSTISDVVYAPYQFSVVSDPRLQGLIDNGAQASCVQAARDACAGNNNIGDLWGFKPSWNLDTSSVSSYKQIGNHVFYK